MKIQYCSDLHLEFSENEQLLREFPIIPVAEILILAGDIIPFHVLKKYDWFINDIASKFKTVYWLPGNHEYYQADAMHRSGSYLEAIRKNVFLINNSVEFFGDTRIAFTTLWSYISSSAQRAIEKQLNDFRLIRYGNKKLTAVQYNKFHVQSKEFFADVFSYPFPGKTVVVTHHVPTMQNYPPKYLGDSLSMAFATELKDFILETQPDYWVFGHHHFNTPAFNIGKTVMLTNQVGYVDAKEHLNFDRKATFEI